MNEVTIGIKRLYDDVELPERGSVSAAGYDLRCHSIDVDDIKFTSHTSLLNRVRKSVADPSMEVIQIFPGETAKIHTGLAVEIPEGYFGGIYARSGFATKQGMRPANCVGVIDSDYRGEIVVAIHNDGNDPVIVNKGDRVAQLVIQPYLPVNFEVKDELSDTVRGEGGFGSTGKN